MESNRRTLAERYRLEEVIGRGGMSTVYRATDLLLGRTVAVKVLLAALAEEDPTYVARFEREARVAAALANRAVVTVYDTGEHHGERFIVMEYVNGRSLAEILREQSRLTPPEAVRIAEQVASALAAAHAAGILHRDIKPANVMLTADGSVKVLDFGIARPLQATTLTQSASLVGTAAYMAPERALGETGEERSDVYSLGCLLYAMLTGGPPFSGELPAVVLNQQVNAQPRPPSELAGEIPPGLDALVLAMLAKSPNERPASAHEVAERLAAVGRDPALGAVPSPTEPTTPIHATRATVPIGAAAPLGAAAAVGAAAAARAQRSVPPRRSSSQRQAGRPGHSRGVAARRAVIAAIVTAAVALVAIALISGGGAGSTTTGKHPTVPPARAHTPPSTTVRTVTVNVSPATTPAKRTQTAPTPKAPPTGPPATPPGPGAAPPGHGHHHGHGPGGRNGGGDNRDGGD